eukprot:644107-Rhodomonas_salina.1
MEDTVSHCDPKGHVIVLNITAHKTPWDICQSSWKPWARSAPMVRQPAGESVDDCISVSAVANIASCLRCSAGLWLFVFHTSEPDIPQGKYWVSHYKQDV